jgi:uridine kinase
VKITIQLKLNPNAEPRDVEIEAGESLEQIAKTYQSECPHRILAAKIGNRLFELMKRVEEPCCVTLLDIRDNAAYMIYQRTISFLYYKAAKDVLGDVRVTIGNSLNKGLFTFVEGWTEIPGERLDEIGARMRDMIEQDLPIGMMIMPGEDARIYALGAAQAFFYGPLAPSTGYVPNFELVPYKEGAILRFPHPNDPEHIPAYVDEPRMYQAFNEARDWAEILDVRHVYDLKKACETGRIREIIMISEALHDHSIVNLADRIKEENKHIILIAGPSSSGKTTFARRLIIQLKVLGLHPLYIGMDDYYREREDTPLGPDGKPDFEAVEAIDIDLFQTQMNALLAGETVDIPHFNFVTGSKEFGKRITKGAAGQPIVLEGIHGLNEKLTSAIPAEEKFKIYISPLTQLAIDSNNRIPTTDARMLRRIVRDNQFRGYSAEKTILQWPKVRAGEDKNIFPYNSSADAFFNTAHIYELAVLKKYAEPLLAAIPPDSDAYSEARRMLEFLRYFPTCEDDDVIVNNSILREFIGGSVFETKD